MQRPVLDATGPRTAAVERDEQHRAAEGMTLADARAAYRDYSGKTSDAVRQLGFAGLALVWVLSTDSRRPVPPAWPLELLVPAILIVSSLALDLAQYLAGSLLWGAYHRRQERAGVRETATLLAPRWINWPAVTFFW